MVTIPHGSFAASDFGVSIIQTTPSDASGAKGDNIDVLGTIFTLNGSYQLFVGKTLVASGKADGYYVETNFTVPELPAASYALILRDVTINVNASGTFNIKVGYSATAASTAIQEGESVSINVAVTGGALGKTYGAKVEVISPSGASYLASVELGIPNIQGTASKTLLFPSAAFSNIGNTDLAGAYTIKFNSTLGSSFFNVNILDSDSYHRGDTIKIRATGYEPNQAVTITVTGSTGTLNTFDVSATADGKIDTTWIVAPETPIGECNIKITPSGTQKITQDKQTFSITGFIVTVHTINLSGSPVPQIDVQCIDSATGAKTNSTTDLNGNTFFTLEKGDHSLTAYSDDVNVGQANITVTGDETFNLKCRLSDMEITVQTEAGIAMPFVNLDIVYQYQSSTISRNGSIKGQTGYSGSFNLSSTIAGATYTISASLYNEIFNTNNNTATSLSNEGITQVTIICPSKNVTLGITGYGDIAIPEARVELVEQTNGLFYSAITGSNGEAVLHPTFGNYRLRVYKDNTLLKETNIQVFDNIEEQLYCSIYGIQISVSVIDVFGSPISNANVTLNGSETTSVGATKSNGIATFTNIIGGNMQIIAQISGSQDASQAITVTVNESMTVQIKMEKYISVGGALVQASTLTTIIIVIVIAFLFLGIDLYCRRKVKPSVLASP